MTQTARLLRIVGSPFMFETESPRNNQEVMSLYYRAVKNRMPLLYLTAIKKWNKLGKLKQTYIDIHGRSQSTYDAMLRLSAILREAAIEYALFKTVRPYLETTVDIDVIILEQGEDYKRSISRMNGAGYERLGHGPNSITFKDPYLNIGVDLYREVAVSQVIYLDKDKIRQHVIEKNIGPNGETIRTLSPPADLIAIIAHSMIKEQMYTLSEYYSTLYFLVQMDSRDLETFIGMIYENALTNSARVHIGITAQLHEIAHGTIPEKIRKILYNLQLDPIEIHRSKTAEAPYKFHILTVGKALWEKIRVEEKARKSISRQIESMLDPSFSKVALSRFIGHVLREAY